MTFPKSRDQIIADHPLIDYCRHRGVEFVRVTGGEHYARCPLHEDRKPSFRVNDEKQTWFCDPCGVGGSVIDLVMQMDCCSLASAMEKLGGKPVAQTNGSVIEKFPPKASDKIVAAYDYTDAEGRLLYQVVRMEPKDFRQRRVLPDGSKKWGMDGVSRVLYNLPKIKEAEYVWVVEGEKDADLLNSTGLICATTNAGGAGKWEDQYTEQLEGKEVILCGDNDDAGRKHVKLVEEKLRDHVKTLRVIKVPDGYKDVSEYAATFPSARKAAGALVGIASDVEVVFRGKPIPVRSMDELERDYTEFVRRSDAVSLNLGHWLPTMAVCIRPLVPGEMVCVVADTGVGKTMILQNIAIHSHLPTLLFEIELPGTLTFERFAGIATRSTGRMVQEAYQDGRKVAWRDGNKLGHISVCAESRLIPSDIERIIEGAGIKTGQRPVVVMIDYIQLIRGAGKSRYENMSLVAEELKVIAKATNTILIICSQVARKDEGEIGLHDAKDSGSIENSCGLVLGAWRDTI